MKKILLPIFGGVLLTSSLSLTTGQNANVVVKQQENQKLKEQELFESWYSKISQNGLSDAEIKKIQLISQNWDDAVIGEILNSALEFNDNQVTINWDKVDVTKLPFQILENINISLENLNNVIKLGYIKVNITSNNMVQLIYPNTNSVASDKDIIYFEDISNKDLASTYSSYMWYTTYGPSEWWKFWEWGGIMHFSEAAVQDAKLVNAIASLANLMFLFSNIHGILDAVDQLKAAWKFGDSFQIDKALKGLATALGGADLSLLGEILDIITILTAVAAFVLALLSTPGLGAIIIACLELVVSVIVQVTKDMISADRGKGVKWIWPYFVIPDRIMAE